MTGLEVQALKEAEDARIWEEINAPDPAVGNMVEAAESMKQAEDFISKAEGYLMDAVNSLDGFPMADRVESLENDLEDLLYSIQVMREKYERGWRE